MTKFFNKSKNPAFGPFLVHFPNFGGKFFPPENLTLSRTASYGFPKPCPNLQKTNDRILRMPGKKDRRKDGQTPFYRTLPATTRGPIK